MKQLDELKKQVRNNWGLRWNEDLAGQAKNSLEATHSNPLDAAFRLLNGETYFFRYPLYLQVLRSHMQRTMAAEESTYRVLSAGCSSGEEAYSIAFALKQEAAQAGKRLEVLGIDVRPEAIRVAQSGKYRKWSMRNRKMAQLEDYLSWTGNMWEVREEFKKVVNFRVHNLLDPMLFGTVHAVVSCNVLLYMHEEGISKVYRNLESVLHPKGVLMIAPTDPAPPLPWRPAHDSAGWPVFLRNQPVEELEPILRPSAPKRPRKTTRGVATKKFSPAKTAPTVTIAEEEVPETVLWQAWARGELRQAADQVRRKLFFEPEHPLWRFLNGVILWENGWLRKSNAEMKKAYDFLLTKESSEMLAELCTVEELRRMIEFWRQQHG